MRHFSIPSGTALFIGGAIFGYLLVTLALVPIFYGFPRSMIWAFKRWARWYAPLLYVMTPLLWGVLLLGIWFASVLYGPDIVKNFLWTQNVILGQAAGVILGIGREMLSKYALNRRKEKFLKFMMPHLTDIGLANVQMRWPPHGRS